MMKVVMLVALVCAVAQTQLAAGAPINSALEVFSFSYALGDGTHHEQKAILQNAGTPEQSIEVSGLWLTPDGKSIETKYIIDKDGIHYEDISPEGLSAALLAALVGGGR